MGWGMGGDRLGWLGMGGGWAGGRLGWAGNGRALDAITFHGVVPSRSRCASLRTHRTYDTGSSRADLGSYHWGAHQGETATSTNVKYRPTGLA